MNNKNPEHTSENDEDTIGENTAQVTPKVTPDVTLRIAELSRLRLNQQEVENFSSQLASILEYVSDMDALVLEGIQPTTHPYPLKNVYREDEPTEDLIKSDEVLELAPETESGQFKVPPILKEE